MFSGIGKLRFKQVTLHIDPAVKPVAQPLRWIPFNLQDKEERKFQEFLDCDIIDKVNGRTPWVNPVVIIPKADGNICLCIDMRRANEAIIRGRCPIPTVDELLHNMNDYKVFSKLDLKWGYHQLELSPESRQITAFVTHKGLYSYKRLLLGLSSASELYQHEISTALAWIEGVDNISDDIIVMAQTRQLMTSAFTKLWNVSDSMVWRSMLRNAYSMWTDWFLSAFSSLKKELAWHRKELELCRRQESKKNCH